MNNDPDRSMLPSDQEAEDFLRRQIDRLPPRVAEYVAKLRRSSLPIRLTAALLLIVGGLAWFLPVLGLWMLPLGLLLLAEELPITKRVLAWAGMFFARKRRDGDLDKQ
jgi:hypothetical protein